ncbi:peroxiredoxin [Wenzhouxiangella sp. AB-CW3]|uniref:peroxiredoxin n=1 Tax=Wenzhouxiangella sp. AB-CW3 TaxID=2771012 RepID=UPI00168B2C65|nr:peroxiredoxin [Wenzhouxiangella sp. AB-CW3]QOC23820.1 peroxiredoxin [Wenzhouxiangella sp. AB-CW3]
MTIPIGHSAPDFTLPDQDEQPFRLSDSAGKRLLLVFYPGDETPVCTRQLCDYRDGLDSFADLGVEVVGISRDDAESHRRFRERHQLPFTLLSDPDMSVADQYGCRGLLGMKRGVFLVDESGIVRYAHVEAVAAFRRRREELVEAIGSLE